MILLDADLGSAISSLVIALLGLLGAAAGVIGRQLLKGNKSTTNDKIALGLMDQIDSGREDLENERQDCKDRIERLKRDHDTAISRLEFRCQKFAAWVARLLIRYENHTPDSAQKIVQESLHD